MIYCDNALAALYTIQRQKTRGIPTWLCHIMEHSVIERIAGTCPGSYINDPYGTYIQMQKNIGTCFIDQYIPENPLSMEAHGYEKDKRRRRGGP